MVIVKKISVIVPVYNTVQYLEKCIESILHQKQWIYEIILVDDGSTDGSAAICDEYQSKWPTLIHVVHQQNQGAAAARNRGLELARGEILSFVDSDDYLEHDMYERLTLLMEKYGADMAAGSMWIEKVNGEKFCRVSECKEFCWSAREALIELNSYRYLYTSFCNGIFTKNVMENLHFPEVRACEDYFLLFRVIAQCSKIAYTSKPVYNYVQRENSNSRSKTISFFPVEASKAQLKFFKEFFPDIVYVAETDFAFACMSIYTSSVRHKGMISSEQLKQLQAQCYPYLHSVWKNSHIPWIKKLQAAVFCFMPQIYKLVIDKTEHR